MKNIGIIILGMVFLISSSGFLMYKSHCSCTGNEQVSVFVNRDVCETQEAIEEEQFVTCCAQVIEVISCCTSNELESTCENHTMECDCDQPEVTYVKLKHQIVKEEVSFLKVEPVQVLVAFAIFNEKLLQSEDEAETLRPDKDPPPDSSSSSEFLVKIQQLKIPLIA